MNLELIIELSIVFVLLSVINISFMNRAINTYRIIYVFALIIAFLRVFDGLVKSDVETLIVTMPLLFVIVLVKFHIKKLSSRTSSAPFAEPEMKKVDENFDLVNEISKNVKQK